MDVTRTLDLYKDLVAIHPVKNQPHANECGATEKDWLERISDHFKGFRSEMFREIF